MPEITTDPMTNLITDNITNNILDPRINPDWRSRAQELNFGSEILAAWVIAIDEALPPNLHNMEVWKNLIPLAAQVGPEHATENVRMIMDWMWDTILPRLGHVADEHGVGPAWQKMISTRDHRSAMAATQKMSDVHPNIHVNLHVGLHVDLHGNSSIPSTLEARHAGASLAALAAASAAAFAARPDKHINAVTAAANAAESAASCFEEASVFAWEQFDPVGLLYRIIEDGIIEDGRETAQST